MSFKKIIAFLCLMGCFNIAPAQTPGADSVKNEVTQMLDFAKTLIGVPYKYATEDPDSGFDCSGFVNYVFAHSNITVPRVSSQFENIGKDVVIEEALPGDIILFTGTDSKSREIGHVGIITENNGSEVKFIHASSYKNIGVIISSIMDGYYFDRLIKVVSVFKN